MTQDDFATLVYKELQGDLSAEEAKALQAWLAQSAEHQQIKESIKVTWEMLDDFDPNFEIDTQTDYRKVRQQMQAFDQTENKTTTKPISLFSRRRVLSIAASVLFILTAAWVFNFFQSPPLEMILAQTQAGEIKQIHLSDQSSVWLNENSQLEYPKQFDGQERAVTLTGEAFFDISPDANKPFRIGTAQAMVEVLGTSFNVRALAGEDKTSIAVESGKVRFSAKATENAVILEKEESASLNHDQLQFAKTKTTDYNAFAWKTKQLGFRAQPLGKVFETIENHFGITIEVKNPAFNDCLFTMPVQQLNLDQFWQNLTILYQIKLEKPGEKTYLISGGRCD